MREERDCENVSQEGDVFDRKREAILRLYRRCIERGKINLARGISLNHWEDAKTGEDRWQFVATDAMNGPDSVWYEWCKKQVESEV